MNIEAPLLLRTLPPDMIIKEQFVQVYTCTNCSLLNYPAYCSYQVLIIIIMMPGSGMIIKEQFVEVYTCTNCSLIIMPGGSSNKGASIFIT